MEHYVGQVILHQGRYKTVRAVGKDWIETIYLKPNDKGWRKVEKIYFGYDKPNWIKLDQYKFINFEKNAELEKLINFE